MVAEDFCTAEAPAGSSAQGQCYTAYVVTVEHHCSGAKWVLHKTYEQFYKLHQQLAPAAAKAFPPGFEANYKFPLEWLPGSWFTLTDALRRSRMEAINLWFRELYLNPVMLLQSKVLMTLMKFLNAKEFVRRKI